jgi:hypothetical protein
MYKIKWKGGGGYHMRPFVQTKTLGLTLVVIYVSV